ncbi:MAG: ABC transporter ATP-binding protein [Prochlorothrix sp.]|nr:ABC transporter ATP-binding protein [Prochlorothrix sp.]
MTRLALVVGIDTYQALPSLPLARTSATAIAQRLERYGNCTVQQLPTPVATDHPGVSVENPINLANLKENLIELFQPRRGLHAKTVIFYFAGYAVLRNSGLQEGFLMPSDGHPTAEPNGLSFFWLQRLLRDSPVEQWAVWLDCWQVGEPEPGAIHDTSSTMGPSRLGSQGLTRAGAQLMPRLNLMEADPGEKQGHDRLFLGTCQPAPLSPAPSVAPAAYGSNAQYGSGLSGADFHGMSTALGATNAGLVNLAGSTSLSPLSQAIIEGLDPDRSDSGVITSAFLHNWVSAALTDRVANHHWRQSGQPLVLSRALQDFCPYKGLAYFDCNTEDPHYFHGREALTATLIENIQHRRFLAVLGPSGSGKSSVLRAGLIHQLKLGQQIPDSDQWKIHILQPGGHPLLNLAFAFLDLNLPLVERAKQLGEVEQLLSQGSEGMRRLVQASAAPRLVLVVDQFEELFTLCRDKAERQLFLDCLLGAMNLAAEGRYAVPLQVVIGMRSDFFSACNRSDYAVLGEAIQHNHLEVPPLTATELQDAICKPAQQLGVTLEPELVQQMITDVDGASNALPLLEYTLTELWQQRRDRRLNLVDYIRLGGIRGTLEKRANTLYHQLDPEQQAAIQHIFLSLTQFGDGVTEDSRRRVFKQDLATPQFSPLLIDSLVQRLANEKLVVTSAWAPPGTGLGEEQVVDVIHEALIRHWGLLRRWISLHRDDLRQQRELQELAEQWFRKGKSPDYLLQGEALGEALEFWLQWTQSTPEQQSQIFHRPLSGLVQEFLGACQEGQQQRLQATQEQEQQIQQQRRQTQRVRTQLRTLALGAGGILAGALLLLSS